jgi:hypothetical protein
MPEPPRKNESQKAFLGRCISFMTKNKEGKDPAQRAAVCYSMWRSRKKSKKGDIMTEEEQKQKQWIKEGKNPTAGRHNYPEVPPLPENFVKPKTYVEHLEDEVRGDVPDRMGNFHDGY